MLGNRAIENRVAKLQALEEQAKAIEAQMETIKSELKADMEEKGVDEIETAHYKIRWKLIESNRFDTAAFKKEFTELYNRYIKKSFSKRFTIAA